MEIQNFNNFLYKFSENLKDEDKIELIYKYPEYNSEYIYHNNENEIKEIFGDKAFEMIINAKREGQYDYNDPYFTIDGYGYIQTFENINEYFDIYGIVEDHSDKYLEDYKDYLLDVLYDINNKEDLDKFKEIIEKEDLTDYFEEALKGKKINSWESKNKEVLERE